MRETASAEHLGGGGHGFGTAPVFLASISTILGAVMFLRFGYAVGHVGLMGTLLIILLGHMVTIPTALAIAEIATNRRVEGGGEYFIISRSFGTTIGGAIGFSLFVSQALSVAFYMIAMAEGFRPLAPAFERLVGIPFDPRYVSLPAALLLGFLVLRKGADLGVQALWAVVAILAASIGMFFLGGAPDSVDAESVGLLEHVADADTFILVFAIVFPAFTGMTAGVGLSGDLANPRRSIPLGVVSATLIGMVVYVAIAWKLAASATPDMLAGDQLVMSRIAVWGPIIPIGLVAATLSSAIGSILVAPRTLQALGGDGLAPWVRVNAFLRQGVGKANEPRNATLVTLVVALFTISLGNVNAVARVISMFFMVTYGALCTISAFEHFAARPSYRPSFRSKWWISLIGAVMSFVLMLQMDPLFALIAVIIMVMLYLTFRRVHGADDLAGIFQGVMTQATRYSQIKLQASTAAAVTAETWRPSVVMINSRTFDRTAPLQFFGWLCHRYGFGTYLHHIVGDLDANTYAESRKLMARLIEMTQARKTVVYVDTIVAPSSISAIAQGLQAPGVSGVETNSVLFEFTPDDPAAVLDEIRMGSRFAAATRTNSLVLRHGPHFFGHRGTIHIWLTWHDLGNANLMILLAYILLGHPDWHDTEIRIFAAVPQGEAREERDRLAGMIASGRLPISQKNLRIIPTGDRVDFDRLVETRSANADLVIFGFTQERLEEKGAEIFRRHSGLRDILFVSAEQRVLID